jgi:uncharacterized protein YjbJ (UPF0337 family)
MSSESAMDKIKGKVKEMTGKATGNDRVRGEGRADRAKGKAKQAPEEARGIKDSLTGRSRREP